MGPQADDHGTATDVLHDDQRRADDHAGQSPVPNAGILNDPVGTEPGEHRDVAVRPLSQDEIDQMARDSDQDYASQQQIDRAQHNDAWDVPAGDKTGHPTRALRPVGSAEGRDPAADDWDFPDVGDDLDAADMVNAGD